MGTSTENMIFCSTGIVPIGRTTCVSRCLFLIDNAIGVHIGKDKVDGFLGAGDKTPTDGYRFAHFDFIRLSRKDITDIHFQKGIESPGTGHFTVVPGDNPRLYRITDPALVINPGYTIIIPGSLDSRISLPLTITDAWRIGSPFTSLFLIKNGSSVRWYPN